MTSKEILVNWLVAQINSDFQYHDIEQRVPAYGINFHHKLHNASNYAREFRKIREDRTILRHYGIDIVEVDTDSIAGKWKVIKLEKENVD